MRLRKFLESRIDLIFYILVIAALAVGAYERNRVWLTEKGLWMDCMKKSPGKDRPKVNLASALMREGKLPEAKGYLEEAVRLGGVSQLEANNNLGIIYGEEERYADAFACFARATKINDKNPQVENNFGLYKFNSGDADEAMLHIKKALALDPDFDMARLNFQRIVAMRISESMVKTKGGHP